MTGSIAIVLAAAVCLAPPGPCLVELCEYPGRDSAMWDGLVAARDGRVYSALISEGESAHLYVYDLTTRTTTNLGRVANWDVCRNIFCDDQGNVYGSFPVGRVWKYDARTERVEDLSIRMPYDPTIWPTQLNNPMIDRSCDWRAVAWAPAEKVAYGVTCGSGSILFRYDPHRGPEGEFRVLGRLCDSRFLSGDRKDIPFSPLAFALDAKRRRVYFVPSARAFSVGRYAETFGASQTHHLIEFDLARSQRIDRGPMQTADRRRVFGCEGASVGPDGTLYLCGQAEVRDPGKATSHGGNLSAALHLIVVRPRGNAK